MNSLELSWDSSINDMITMAVAAGLPAGQGHGFRDRVPGFGSGLPTYPAHFQPQLCVKGGAHFLPHALWSGVQEMLDASPQQNAWHIISAQ